MKNKYSRLNQMNVVLETSPHVNQRVRAILLTDEHRILFIKRVKPNKPNEPYWVAPGGGVEGNETLTQTLSRELCEELGAEFEVLGKVFVLEHEKAGKQLEEHFFICRLIRYDLSKRSGPEFEDDARGEYIPQEIPLTEEALTSIYIKTVELRNWLLNNLEQLRHIS